MHVCLNVSIFLGVLVFIYLTADFIFLFFFFITHLFPRSNFVANDIQIMLVLVGKNSFNNDHKPREGTGI
jgi:hypothetical protein